MSVTSLLEELASKLMSFGNHTLDAVVNEFWSEFSAAVQTVVFPHRDKTLAKRSVAALFASRVYLQVGRLPECLQYALAAGDLFDTAACDAYAAAIVARCLDRYAARDPSPSPSSPPPSPPSPSSSWHACLESVVGRVLDKCLEDRDHRLLLGLGLRARRMDVVAGCVAGGDADTLRYAARVAVNLVDAGDFRDAVLCRLVHAHGGRSAPDHLALARCFVWLDDAESAARVLRRLARADGTKDDHETLFRVAFDVYEMASQWFLARVLDSLRRTVRVRTTTATTTTGTTAALTVPTTRCGVQQDRPANAAVGSADVAAAAAAAAAAVAAVQPDTELITIEPDDEYSQEMMHNLLKVLSGAMSIEHNSQFLTKHNNAYTCILNKTKEEIHTSILHTATMIANGFMHSGTAYDNFLREYLGYANTRTTWELFSAIVSLGAIYRGHEACAIELINSYLNLTNRYSLESSGHSKGGGLYALGLIYANHGTVINDYLLRLLKEERNEIVKHGGCLGIGLSAMGTRRKDIYEQLKTILYQDNAVFGEATGLAMGLVMLGSKNSEALQDMVTHAQITQHENILRGLSVGISFFMYGRLEEADSLITHLLQDKNPILRCSAMHTISMAYCGTGSQTAVKKLLHAAYSDLSDEVRCTAVTSLGFLLFRVPEQCLQIIGKLTKSYNPYVRYGAAMALGIACAGTGHGEAIDLLEPMINDLVNYVRQGALIASALICIQQTENTCSKMKYFHTLYARVITENYEDDVVKFGAILAQGIIDGGGRNVSISLDSKTGYLNTSSVVGLLLFTQYQYSICLSHCLTLAFTPIFTIGFDTKLKMPIFELKSCNQIKPEVCFSSLCQDLAEKRGWIQHLFNKHCKPKYKKLKGRLLKLDIFAYRFLIPKIVRDVEVIKSNWQTGHFLLQRINCRSTEYFKGVNCVQFDSSKIVSGLCDNTIKIWNKYTLECVKVLIGHTGSVVCLQYDEKMIISGSSDTTVRVWNIVNGDVVNILTHHREAVLHLKFNDNTLVTCSEDRSIAIWNILSPSEIIMHCVLIGHQAEVNVVNFDNKYIVSGSRDCTIKVWNTISCDFVCSLIGHNFGITCLQYKDRLVVSGSFDNTIRLWDIEYGTCLRILEDCEELVFSIKFNNKIIVSGAYDGKIKVWDLEAALDPSVPESSLCLRTLKVHNDTVYDLQFDEFQIISCSKDDTILVWDFLNYDKANNVVVDS